MCVLQFLKNIDPVWIAAVAAVATGVFVWRAFRNSRKTFRHTVFQKLLEEYSTPEMAVAIRWLWAFHEECLDESELVSRYAEIAAQFQENPDEDSPHASQRRRVCLFYKRLAALSVSRVLPLRLIMKWWNKGTLDIIPKILEPIEAKGIPKGMGNDPKTEDQYEPSLKNMLKLYKAVERRTKTIQFLRKILRPWRYYDC